MKYTYNLIDLTKYTQNDKLNNGVFEYKLIEPLQTSSRNNHNSFFAKRNLYYDLHLGEFLAGIIGKRQKFKICDVGLYKHPININDKGVVSYANLSSDDKLLNPSLIINSYLKSQNLPSSKANSIDVIFNAIFTFMYKNNRPYHEFIDFKQDFIDMVIYDLVLLNPDRDLQNWLLRYNTSSKSIDLYNMFDNEMILGLDTTISSSEFTDELIENENKKRTSAILTPDSTTSSSNFDELFEYLLKNYPIQTNNSLSKFNNFSEDDLAKILDDFDELSVSRKEFSLLLFNKRRNELIKLRENFIKKEKQCDER